jgi:dTDP-4-dehydrorhamnose reductase
MDRILIVGVSSLVGSHLAIRLRDRFNVIGTFDRHRPNIDSIALIRLNLRRDIDWGGVLERLRPRVVFYCAAERNEKLCQEQPINALAVNAEIPASIAAAAEGLGIRTVYFSSSKVFSGDQGDYSESSLVDPIGHYGMSKVRAEELLASYSGVFTLRLGTLFGLGPVPDRSLLNQMRNNLLAGAPFPLIDDEFRSFQSAEWVAEASERLLKADWGQGGIYHLPSPPKESHFSFGSLLSLALGVGTEHIERVSGEEYSLRYPGVVNRGKDTSLNGNLFESTFGIKSKSTPYYVKKISASLEMGSF